jgi:hypothetical protein
MMAGLGGCGGGAAVSRLESKFLNNRTESRVRGSVTNLRTIKKFFTNSLRLDCRESDFSKRLLLLWG